MNSINDDDFIHPKKRVNNNNNKRIEIHFFIYLLFSRYGGRILFFFFFLLWFKFQFQILYFHFIFISNIHSLHIHWHWIIFHKWIYKILITTRIKWTRDINFNCNHIMYVRWWWWWSNHIFLSFCRRKKNVAKTYSLLCNDCCVVHFIYDQHAFFILPEYFFIKFRCLK